MVFGPLAHARKAIALPHLCLAEASAIVGHFQDKPSAVDPELYVCFCALGVPNDVIEALFEYEIDLAAKIRAKSYVPVRAVGSKAKGNVSSAKDVAGESSHSLRQFTNPVLRGVDRPDDIAHGINQLAGDAGD